MRVLALACLAAAQVAAQPLAYSLLSREGPAPRFDGTIAYDPAGAQVFLFGGAGSGNLNDLWSYSLALGQWQEVAAGGARPAARFGHTLNFDPVRRRLILFGGQASGFFSDVWAYDIAARQWTQLARDQAGPSNRYGHSAIYDAARDRLVISHGFTDAGRFDDTWAFELRSNAWRNISPAAGRPLRRCLHHAVYDGGDGMLLYGGCASGFGPCPLGDLWRFDLAANRWTELRPVTTPAPRQHYGFTYDAVRRRAVVFGGSGRGALNDTWEFDADGGGWREAEIRGSSPSARSRHQSAYAADRGVSFFFGGATESGLSNELWTLGPAVSAGPLLTGVANAFSAAPGAVSPGELVSIYGANLGPAGGVAFRFDDGGRLPRTGAGVSVSVNGTAAPLLYAGDGQINLQVPYEVAGAREARIEVTVAGAASSISVPLQTVHPGLFPVAFHPDGRPVSAEAPARPGQVIVLFATGYGMTNPAGVTGEAVGGIGTVPAARVGVSAGSRDAEVLYAGAVTGTVGVLQVNVRLPAEAAELVTLRVGEAEASLRLP